ncbi:MAG: acyltransferase, partial [Erythrobacter sp.]
MSESRITYRPDIDGLRTLAVLPVVLFHMKFDWIEGGFLGVDVFFVISGFLITSILVSDLHSGKFSLREFYKRRVRRILPALTFLNLCVLAFGYLYCFGFDVPEFASQAIASSFSYANIHFWLQAGDYWGKAAEEAPLLHCWSLSVEEQYYLFFPLLLWACWRYLRSFVAPIIAVLVACSLILFLVGMARFPTSAFYLLPTRAWEIGAGALLGLFQHYQIGQSRGVRFGPHAAFAGILVLLGIYLSMPNLAMGAILATLATCTLLQYGNTPGLVCDFLSSAPMRAIGKLSYS